MIYQMYKIDQIKFVKSSHANSSSAGHQIKLKQA